MSTTFKFEAATLTEFGVGLEEKKGYRFALVPVDSTVQSALREMAIATRNEMTAINPTPSRYEPSEKYASSEHLHLPLDDPLASQIRAIHQAANLPMDVKVLSNASDVFCYFMRMSDGKTSRLTALRRAATFKGILNTRVIRLMTDALAFVEEKVFRLDNEFDLLIDEAGVHILKPSGFEFVGQLHDAILAAAPENIKRIEVDLPFVDFSPIQEYAVEHPRAARYLASIRVQKETKKIDKSYLKKLCSNTGVKVHEANGKLVVEEHSIMGFLGVLDRRMYQVELVKGSPESYRASSRSRIGTAPNKSAGLTK